MCQFKVAPAEQK